MTVTHDTLVARRGLEIGIAPQEVSDFRLDRVREQGTRTVTQNLSQRIAESSRLSQLDDVTVVHGVSLLWWRSGGSNTPTIRRLTPSCRHQLPRIARLEKRRQKKRPHTPAASQDQDGTRPVPHSPVNLKRDAWG